MDVMDGTELEPMLPDAGYMEDKLFVHSSRKPVRHAKSTKKISRKSKFAGKTLAQQREIRRTSFLEAHKGQLGEQLVLDFNRLRKQETSAKDSNDKARAKRLHSQSDYIIYQLSDKPFQLSQQNLRAVLGIGANRATNAVKRRGAAGPTPLVGGNPEICSNAFTDLGKFMHLIC